MKTIVATGLVALLALAGSSRAAHRPHTIVYITGGIHTPRIRAMAKGGRAAAKVLGVRYVLAGTDVNGIGEALLPVYNTMIARHVDAIAADGYDTTLTPIMTKVRKSGILLVASGDDIAAARDVWIGQAGKVAYSEALADALASQIHGQGEYAILEQQDEYPVADVWGKLVASYVRKAYPNMKLDAVVRGTGAGDPAELDSVKQFISSHPQLKGLVGITPTEAAMAAEAIAQSHSIGKVFSAGNGGSDLVEPSIGWARSGAAEFVYGADPVKLGYLTVWAANYLLTGHRFKWGAYQVGGPIGMVRYYADHRELRLGQPLTITKTNVDLYANTF